MKRSKKYAWTWIIKKDCVEKYVEMHLNPWPELLEEHSNAGIKNYSIFQNGNQFFYCFECEDIESAFKHLATSKVCQEWNSITSQMVDGSFDFSKENPLDMLKEVFYLP